MGGQGLQGFQHVGHRDEIGFRHLVELRPPLADDEGPCPIVVEFGDIVVSVVVVPPKGEKQRPLRGVYQAAVDAVFFDVHGSSFSQTSVHDEGNLFHGFNVVYL